MDLERLCNGFSTDSKEYQQIAANYDQAVAGNPRYLSSLSSKYGDGTPEREAEILGTYARTILEVLGEVKSPGLIANGAVIAERKTRETLSAKYQSRETTL